MKHYLSKTWLLGLLLLAAPLAVAEETWQPLFNGKDLAGWTSQPELNHWAVEEGTIVGSNGAGMKGSTLWTAAKFADFILELEYKYDGTVDSGVFVKGDPYQVNIGQSSSLKTDMTCSIYAPKDGEKYPGKARGVAEVMKPGEWNRLRIEARGKRISVQLNGVAVLTYDTKNLAASGPLGLQVHAGLNMKIKFRNPRIISLP